MQRETVRKYFVTFKNCKNIVSELIIYQLHKFLNFHSDFLIKVKTIVWLAGSARAHQLELIL